MNRIEKCAENFEKLFSTKPADRTTGNDPEMMMIHSEPSIHWFPGGIESDQYYKRMLVLQ